MHEKRTINEVVGLRLQRDFCFACPCWKVMLATVLYLCVSHFSSAEEPPIGNRQPLLSHRRFEYKLSFKGPHLVQGDGVVPFWQHTGSAIASDDSVRVTPSLKSKKGSIWSTQSNTNENWEVEMIFQISGPGRLGADGLAFWYTEEKGVEGPVFGSNDMWKGLAVFMDSFDNDAGKDNPYIMVMLNDGSTSYNHETDGSNQQLGGCRRDFRNRQFPLRMRVTYYQKTLTVHFHNGVSKSLGDFELCLRAENIHLAPNGHYGISAATGGLADDHDVISFLTHSLKEPGDTASPTVASADQAKFEKEFEEYWEKLETAKEDYKKDHPDAKPSQQEQQINYASQETKELQMIFEGQNAIHLQMRELHSQLVSSVSRIESQVQNAVGTPRAGGPPAGGAPEGNIGIQNVDSMMAIQNELLRSFDALRTTVDLLSQKSDTIQRSVTDSGGSQGRPDTPAVMATLR